MRTHYPCVVNWCDKFTDHLASVCIKHGGNLHRTKTKDLLNQIRYLVGQFEEILSLCDEKDCKIAEHVIARDAIKTIKEGNLNERAGNKKKTKSN